tara:strand:- start:610 stop:948 length:339 start_codon:yes stop_codon:yes gene_type:complete
MKLLELSFDLLLTWSSVFSILFIVYKTELLSYYVKLFGIDASGYEKERNALNCSNYLEYWNFKSQSFLSKLFSCPYCFSFWLYLVSCIAQKNLEHLLLIYSAFILSWRFIDE